MLSHQLSVFDKKANNVIFIDSVLILATTLASLFNSDLSIGVRILSSISTVFVLLSAGFCIRIIWTTWSTDLDKDDVGKLRDSKTRYLKGALIALLISLAIFIILVFEGIYESLLKS
jgi:hypothetical protein